MFMVSVIDTGKKDSSDDKIYKLLVDGVIDETASITGSRLDIKSSNTFTEILKLSHNEIPTEVNNVFYVWNEDWSQVPIEITISIQRNKLDHPYIWIGLMIDPLDWRNRFSIAELAETYQSICEERDGITYVTDLLDDYNYFPIEVVISDKNVPLSVYVEFGINSLKQIHLLSLEVLNKEYELSGITTLFEFPSEIKSACNQYLMYFAQFLEDLGIRADTSIKEKANEVLFTVIPHDKNQALEVIYEALSAFIKVADEGVQSNEYKDDISLMQLKSNIFHLKSQLQLAKAVLQSKDATIQALEISNYQLQSIVIQRKNILQDKIGEKEEEEVLGGIATIKKYEGKGYSINLPEILRRLKRRFGK